MESFESKVADLKDDAQFERGFWHEDGSFTAILRDDDPDHANPRDNDGNVAHLVTTNSDYREIDEPCDPIVDADQRWGFTGRGGARGEREHAAELTARYLSIFFPDIVAFEPRWSVQSFNDVNHGYAYVLRSDWDEAFPDVDPAVGYTYREAMPGDPSGTYSGPEKTITPADCIAQEVDVYGQWFAGEVYGYSHVEPGEIIVTTDVDGEHAECRYCGHGIVTDDDPTQNLNQQWVLAPGEADGDDAELYHESCPDHDTFVAEHEPTRTLKPQGYLTGDGKGGWREYQMDDASVWGFLAYDKLEDIAAEATSSPITETVWS